MGSCDNHLGLSQLASDKQRVWGRPDSLNGCMIRLTTTTICLTTMAKKIKKTQIVKIRPDFKLFKMSLWGLADPVGTGKDSPKACAECKLQTDEPRTLWENRLSAWGWVGGGGRKHVKRFCELLAGRTQRNCCKPQLVLSSPAAGRERRCTSCRF